MRTFSFLSVKFELTFPLCVGKKMSPKHDSVVADLEMVSHNFILMNGGRYLCMVIVSTNDFACG